MNGVDFDRILSPAMRVFGRPIIVDPVVSQRGVPPYPARGVFNSRPIDIGAELGNGVIVSQVVTLGIRLADFAVPPDQGDRISLPPYIYAVSDPPRLDGQGGADLTLKIVGAVT